MKIELSCPLGSTCEKIVDDHIERCAWYVEVAGVKPDGEQVNEWACAMTWMPMLQIETARTNRGQTQAIESMRNETIKRQDKAMKELRLIDVRNT